MVALELKSPGILSATGRLLSTNFDLLIGFLKVLAGFGVGLYFFCPYPRGLNSKTITPFAAKPL